MPETTDHPAVEPAPAADPGKPPCGARTAAGSPCGAFATVGDYCAFHAPDAETRALMAQSRQQGGLAATAPRLGLDLAGAPIDVTSLEGLQQLLNATASAVALARITSLSNAKNTGFKIFT